MKISCQSCAAKYTIADEKVLGKVIKIKCKKCGATIVVNGNDPTLAADAGDGAQGYGGESAAAGPDEWTVSVTDDDQRTMTTADIVAAYQRGELTADTYLWRDGMPGWLPLNQVQELNDALQAGGVQAEDDPAATAIFGQSPLQSGGQNGGDHGGGIGHEAPYAAAAAAPAPLPAAPAAARKPRAATAKVDLFGGGGGAGPALDAHGLPSAVGERNETSVLFSLSALQAAEATAARPSGPSPARSTHGMNADRVDDILGLGGGGVAPMLAPPPLMAPIIEPPPPPPPPVSMAPPPTSYAPAGMAMYQAPPAKKAPVALIAGGGVAALALVGGLAFFLGRGTDTPKPETPSTSVAAEPKKDEPKEEPKADTPKADDTGATAAPPATDTAAPADTSADPKAATTNPSGGYVPSTGAGAKFDPTKKDPKVEEKKDPKAEEKKDPKAEEKKEPPSTSGAPFDRGAASAALGAAAGSSKSCGKPGGPTGSGKVQVTFAPSGKATQATVGAPFAGTPVGSCIAGVFRGARVPPFQGEPMTVSKTVSIK